MTKEALDRLQRERPESEQFLWCARTPGFGARAYPSGRVVFIAQVRVGRAQRRLKIGPYGPLTIDQARERARTILRDAADGRDPQAEKRERREASTVAELCNLYLEAARAGLVVTRFGRPKKASTIAIDEGRVARHIVPLLGKRLARDVSARDVQAMADAIVKGKTAVVAKTGKKRGKAVVTGGGVAAARVVELLGGIWTWAAKRGHIPPVSVTRGVDKIKGRVRSRILSPRELKALGAAIREAEKTAPMAARATKLIVLSGMRREEAVGLTWPEYDREGSCAHLTDTKAGASTRALGAPAAAHLNRLYEQRTDARFVFPNSRGDGPADLKKSIAAIFDAAGLPDARSQAMRRTFASIGDELGYSDAIIGALLGHAKRGVTQRHYVRRPDAALVAAATRIAEQLEAAMSSAPPATISELRSDGVLHATAEA